MTPPKILLIGWDAADWKVIHPLIDAGKMPHLRRFLENGASGPIATIHPAFSPMLWTSIATGKRPFKHGILGFSEPAANGRGAQPITNLSRKSKALWNILSQNDLRSIVVGWWPSHPAEPIRGVMVSDRYHRAHGPLNQSWPLPAGAIHPREFAQSLAGRRVHPDHLTPEMVERFIPRAREIDQDQDNRLAGLLRTLAECMTIQSTAAWLIEHQPWDFFAVYFDSIDHFSHAFMRYHPPRQSWIGERDFDLYRNVVSMAYQLHDEMLGELLEKAGGDATVILMSDHGFHPDHLRPSSIPGFPAGPAVEHRDFGIFAIRGPGIRKNEKISGASILDIAPTILTLYGLPAGEDMDGKVISRAFVERPRIAFVPSWEEIAGDDGRHPPETRVDAVAAREMLEQMIALGYIERPAKNRRTAAEQTVRELRGNLACVYQDAGRHRDALEILNQLHETYPEELRFAVWRFVSCQALGLHEEMRRIVDGLESRQEPLVVAYLRAQLLAADKRDADAVAMFEEIARDQAPSPELLSQTGDLYLRLRRQQDAQRVYDQALEIDPDHTRAHLGLCRLALRKRKFRAAANLALDALNRIHHDPLAHFLLARALSGMKQYEQAAEALRAAISCNPNFPEAHLRLARLLEKHLGDPESAREHQRLVGGMKERPSGDVQLPKITTAVRAAPRQQAAPCESLIIVTGLPRSGTSLVMQMLEAGGIPILADDSRRADENNPRGYFEFEPVKKLFRDSSWLLEVRGKAVKIVAPLLPALPHTIACRVIFCERDLDEILDSQESMLRGPDGPVVAGMARRRRLKEEYTRILNRGKALLLRRPATRVLTIDYRDAVSNPILTAREIDNFLGGETDLVKMATVIDPRLYRSRSVEPSESRP